MCIYISHSLSLSLSLYIYIYIYILPPELRSSYGAPPVATPEDPPWPRRHKSGLPGGRYVPDC